MEATAVADYISRETLLNDKAFMKGGKASDPYVCGYLDALDDLEKVVEAIPAADVVEVVHGEWIATEMYAIDKCSKCGFLMDWDDVPAWLKSFPFFKITCPNCGAKMDGGTNDESD